MDRSSLAVLLSRWKQQQHAAVAAYIQNTALIMMNMDTVLHTQVSLSSNLNAALMVSADSNCRPQPTLSARLDVRLLPDDDALLRFRFTIAEIEEIIATMRLPPTITVNRLTTTTLTAFCMLLRRLTWPNRLVDLAVEFGYGMSSMSRLINEMLEMLMNRYKARVLFWPGLTSRRVKHYADAITDADDAVVGIWGFIDGTFRRIARPKQKQRLLYSGYKRKHGQLYQGVATPDGLVVSMIGPYLGLYHDLTMYRMSQLGDAIRPIVATAAGGPLQLYGDAAYQSEDLIMSPYIAPIEGSPQMEYNKLMSEFRVRIENAFGKITQLWSYLDHERAQRTGLVPTAAYYLTATLMSNIHTCMGQPETRWDIAPPSLMEYLTL